MVLVFTMYKIFQFFFIIKTINGIDLVDKLGDSLENMLQFSVSNSNIIDINLLFGAAIVSGQLSVIAKYYPDSKSQFEIFRMKQLCEQIFQIGFSRGRVNNVSSPTQYTLISPELWTFDHLPQHLNESMLLHLSQQRMEKSYPQNDLVFRQSYDYCLQNLISQCFISDECLRLIRDDKRGGYIITHQILYLQVAKQLLYLKMCPTLNLLDEAYIDWEIDEKCCNVYFELGDNEKKAEENENFLDLLFEEVVVCGLQNYVEFFKPKYLRYIMDYDFQKVNEHKVDGSITSINSLAHLVSVRMAAIVLYLKSIIQINQHLDQTRYLNEI